MIDFSSQTLKTFRSENTPIYNFALRVPMDRHELIHILTLWFVVLIFIQTASGTSDSQVLDAIGIVAILLMYLLPVWLIIGLISDFVESQ